MAVLALVADQLAAGYRKYPIDLHGKLRYAYMSLAANPIAGDIASTIELCDLPPGRVRVLPNLSRLTCSAWGASCTLSIGYRAYSSSEVAGSTPNAEDVDDFMAAKDVSGALAAVVWSTAIKYDVYSVAGVRVFGKIAGAVIPVNATLQLLMAYLYE